MHLYEQGFERDALVECTKDRANLQCKDETICNPVFMRVPGVRGSRGARGGPLPRTSGARGPSDFPRKKFEKGATLIRMRIIIIYED